MKRILNTLLISAVAMLTFSCQEEIGTDAPMNESIVLDLSSGLTKAADTDVESFVNHLDVFIFDLDGTAPGAEVYYERYQVNNAATIALTAKRSSFAAGQKYYVYLLANSNISKEDLETIESYNDLVDRKQEDYNLHLTGLTIEDAPSYFLMDAVAVQDGSSPVVLNNGVYSDNTVLEAVLRRAAAKVVIDIKASDKVEFKSFTVEDGSEGGLYYLRNMPYDTYLLAEARAEEDILTAKVRNTTKSNNAYFDWNPSKDSRNVSLVTYVYPNNWANQSSLEREACVVMNLPMTYTDGENVMDYANCWYKIPMTDDQMFRRNNYYEVNIDLNRPGAISESTPVDLEDVYYSVIDWTEQNVYVGGDDKPKYLMVNEEYMEMRNVSVDATTLEFASSSPVTITVKDIYYYDKFGIKTTVNTAITGTAEEGALSGKITVNSPIPTNQTIRYFTLVVTNEDGITREVQVAQFPLEYITNAVSWYSYRSDFIGDGQSVPTTYENISASNNVTSISYQNGRYTYNTGSAGGFFRSKVVSSTYPSNHNDQSYRGRSDIDAYYWGAGGWGGSSGLRTTGFQDPGNARIYHIQIMASSGDYVLGKPRITDGVTDPGEDNAKLVSPSFMIASRLAVLSVSSIDLSASNTSSAAANAEYLKIYAEHCKQYVEVYDPDDDPNTDNAIHYDDWRLPTAAELGIIYKYQGSANVSADAIDYLLNAGAYFSASGPVTNPSSNTSGTSVRCIRDAY